MLTQLIRRKREWAEQRVVRRGLDTVDRSHQHLWRVPPELFGDAEARADLADVVVLKLDHNKISELPGMEFVFWCSGLRQLDLTSNRLTTLPREVGLVGTLQLLQLKDNRLTSLPQSLADLRDLRLLNVSQNNLQALPDEIGQLTALRRLDVAYNVLEVGVSVALCDCLCDCACV